MIRTSRSLLRKVPSGRLIVRQDSSLIVGGVLCIAIGGALQILARNQVQIDTYSAFFLYFDYFLYREHQSHPLPHPLLLPHRPPLLLVQRVISLRGTFTMEALRRR